RRAQRVLLEPAERDRQIVADLDETVVRRAASHRLLGVIQPGADRKPKLIEPLPPDVDPQLFLKSKGEGGRAVIERGAFDAKPLFVEQRCARQRRRGEEAPAERLLCA